MSPTSIPIEVFGSTGMIGTSISHEKDTYHWSMSFLIVHVLILPSIGLCRMILIEPIFDSFKILFSILNPTCGYVKLLYLFRPWKRGSLNL